MKRSLSMSLIALALTLAAAPAGAAIPRLINFQGRLADSSGTPRVGQWTMVFAVYNAASAGTACFSESQAVAVNSGLFNANIGSVTSGGIASACDFSVPYYLQISVGGEVLSPRIALTAAAYAMRAQIADNSVQLNGLTQGNAAGQIPSNNGVIQAGLNADKLDGHEWTEIPSLIATPIYRCQAGGTLSNTAACTGLGSFGTCYAGGDGEGTWMVYNVPAPPACPSGCTAGTKHYNACLSGTWTGVQVAYNCNCTSTTIVGYMK